MFHELLPIKICSHSKLLGEFLKRPQFSKNLLNIKLFFKKKKKGLCRNNENASN